MNELNERLEILQEMFDNGEITGEEHEEMIAELQAEFTESEEVSPEMLDQVLTAITEQYDNGDLTDDERDALVERAMERYSTAMEATNPVELDHMIYALDLKLESGEITEEQHGVLVERAMERFSESEEEEDVTESEEYLKVAEIIEEQFANGEISEEDKNVLLERAKDRYGVSNDDNSPLFDVESVLESVKAGELTVEEATDMLSVYQEKTTDGNASAIVKAARQKATSNVKAAKAAMKAKDFTKARNLLEAAKEELTKAKSAVQGIQTTTTDAALSLMKDVSKACLFDLALDSMAAVKVTKANKEAKPRIGAGYSNTYRHTVKPSHGALAITAISKIGDITSATKNGTSVKDALNSAKRECIKKLNSDISSVNYWITKCSKKASKAGN